MTKQLYSDSRWWDNPKPRTPVCCTCKHYIGVVDGHVSCKAFSKIPKDIRNDYVIHDHPIEGDHGFQYEPEDSKNVPKLIPRKKLMPYD